MLCNICKDGLERMWDPARRLGLLKEFLAEKREEEEEPQSEQEEETAQVDEQHNKKREFERYIYGHHVDKASFRRSVMEGCAMCNRFSHTGDEKFEKLGYYSVFSTLQRKDELIMFGHFRGSTGGFAFVPVGGNMPAEMSEASEAVPCPV